MVAYQWQCTVGRYVEVTLVLRYHSENKCSETRDKRVKQVYKKNRTRKIVHFTVTGGNEANVDLVLIQPFLLYYVNHVIFMLTSLF